MIKSDVTFYNVKWFVDRKIPLAVANTQTILMHYVFNMPFKKQYVYLSGK